MEEETKKDVRTRRVLRIIRILLDRGGQSIPELQDKLKVSEDTVHRDLALLVKQNLVDERKEFKKLPNGTNVRKIFYWWPDLPHWKREITTIVDEAWHKDKSLVRGDVYDKVKLFLSKDETDVWYPFLIRVAREAGVKVREVPTARIKSYPGEEITPNK